MVKGEIYFMDLAPRSGSEQAGRRPCIIISHNIFSDNPRWRSVTVVPLTTAERWRRASPTTILFSKAECNLPKAGAALAHQVTTLDKSKIISPAIGSISPKRLAQLEAALKNYLVL